MLPICVRLSVLLLAACTLHAQQGVAWPSFRGEDASGLSEGHSLPSKWNVETGEGVKWKAAVPGLGLSSPVIWGDRLYLTTAVSDQDRKELRTGLYGDIASVADESEHVWKVLAYDKSTGELVWENEVHKGVPAVKRHEKSSHANPTIATDGKHLVALFGSEGLYCLNLQGELLWKKDFGVLDSGYFQVPEAQWEFGGSPVIHDGMVVIQADVQKGSFLGVYRLADGEEVWRVSRDDVPTWGSPLVVDTGDRTQVVLNGWKHAGGYDFETGEVLWRVNGGGDIPTPTPIYADGRFILTSAHGQMSPVYAVATDMRGSVELTPDASGNLDWVARRLGSYMATPLLMDGLLYVVRWNGILVCLDPETGERIYQQRLSPGAYTASPVGGDGILYLISESGEVTVARAGRNYAEVATNELGGVALATPAISEGVVYFRVGRSLLAIDGETAQ